MRRLMTSGGGGGKTLVLALAAIAAVLLVVWGAETAPVEAQSGDGEGISGQIVARRLDDARTEFRWLPANSRTPVPPRARYFPPDARVNHWLFSSQIEVGGVEIGRIAARLLEDDRIEFAFISASGERILPDARYFPADPGHDGWLRSSGISFPRFTDDTGITTRAAKKDAIVAALFGYDDAADADDLTYHDYNDFGCPLSRDLEPAGSKADCERWGSEPYDSNYEPGWQWVVEDENGDLVAVPGYVEGHSGWDIQTQTKGSEPFYSLTSGTVVAVDDLSDSYGQFGIIAVRVAEGGPTVVYLHASVIDRRIRVDASVQPGDCLGRQGATGVKSGAHVHLELRNGPARGGSGGAYWLPNGRPAPNPPSIDPIDYLYQSLSRSSVSPGQCDFGSKPQPPPVADGQQMYRPGTGEVYVAKIVNSQRYKRLFLTGEIRDSYGHLRGKEPKTPSQADFDSFTTSCIVRFGSDYYFLDVREGADRANKFRISDGRQGLSAAGVAAAAIFEVHGAEISNRAFDSRGAITAAQAARMRCGS